MEQVYLSLGSNIEPSVQYLKNAVSTLEKMFPVSFCCSSIYTTAPYNVENTQAVYKNCCVSFSTELSAENLWKITSQVEEKYGRKRIRKKKIARTLDIDIIFYGQHSIETENLVIPHYDLHSRDFVLQPLLELNVKLTHPVSHLSLSTLLQGIPPSKRTIFSKMEFPE